VSTMQTTSRLRRCQEKMAKMSRKVVDPYSRYRDTTASLDVDRLCHISRRVWGLTKRVGTANNPRRIFFVDVRQVVAIDAGIDGDLRDMVELRWRRCLARREDARWLIDCPTPEIADKIMKEMPSQSARASPSRAH
jgi:hypothetical protein